MARRVSVKIEGADKLLRALKKRRVDVAAVLEKAATAGAEVLAAAANPNAPEALIETETTSAEPGRVTVAVGPPAEKWYWRFVETGAQHHPIGGPLAIWFEQEQRLVVVGGAQHPGMAARPFLRPAFDEKGGKDGAAQAEVGDVLRRAVE